MKKKLVSIVCSFRNEELTINELINRIDKSLINLNDWEYEIIFVNDYSTDNSIKEIKNFFNKKYNITLINMSRNFGGHSCRIAGFEYASGEAVIYFDTDLQDPPEIFPELIKKYQEGYDVVHTVRKKRLGETKLKIFATKLAYKIITFLSDINLRGESGDFKLLSRKAINYILKFNESDPYLRGLSVWIGFRQYYYEYIREPRKYGSSKYSMIQAAPEFLRGVTSFSVKPLYLGIILGFFSVFVSFGLIVFSIIAKLLNTAVPGVSGILIAISFFSGIIMLNIGLLGIYVAKINNQVMGRPRYIIENIQKSNE
jgi:glycosyltransferase involved in cell wall biosynthesis